MAEESDKTKGGDLVQAVEKFFLDLVGTIVPGLVLLLLGWLLFTTGHTLDWKSIPFFPEKSPWIVIVGLAYVLGHGLASVGEFVLVRIFDLFLTLFRKSSTVASMLGSSLRPQRELFSQTTHDPTFVAFTAACRNRIPALSEFTNDKIPILVWRSFAMSFAPNQRETVYRFMFLSLLNLGIATSFVLAASGTIVVWCGHHFGNLLGTVSAPPIWAVALLLLATIPFLERRYYFYRVSTVIPFGMALAELSKSAREMEISETQLPTKFKAKCVYLAGGFHSGWQERVTGAFPNIEFRNPRKHGLKDKAAYTLWDLEAIRGCDLVFAYLEERNPGGYALALEVGFAKALSKRIIFVNEKGSVDAQTNRALHMVEAVADVHLKTFEEGMHILSKLSEIL